MGIRPINLGAIHSLGIHDLGAVHSLAIGHARATRSGKRLSPLQAILAKMDTEMPGLRDSLVCWYHPKLQLAEDGMTPEEFNEYLAETWPTCEGGLRDLSGNGRDMTLQGMDGYASGMQGDALVFDGVDDYGYYADARSTDLLNQTTFHKSYFISANNNYAESFVCGNTSRADLNIGSGFVIEAFNRISGTSARFALVASPYSATPDNLDDEEVLTWNRLKGSNCEGYWCSNDYVKTPTIGLTDAKREYSQNVNTYLLATQGKSTVRLKGMRYQYTIVFSKVLTDPEIEWVKDNIINF